MSSNIRSFIKGGQFTKRFNLHSNRDNTPDAVLSTISSAPSEDDDGYETPIDDYPQERSKIAGELGTTGTPPPPTTSGSESSSRHDKPIARRILNSFPSILSSRSSRTSRTSTTRTSTASRNSASSTVNPMPTIEETPHIPEFPFETMDRLENGDMEISPAPEQPGTAVPFIAPPPNFQPIRNHADSHSIASTLIQTPPRGNTAHSNAPFGSPPKYTPRADGKTSPLPTWPLPSAQSEKSHVRYSQQSASSRSKESSRFSWPMTKTEKTQSFFTRWFVDWWMFEICCWLFSAVCMSIIFGVIAHYNGKPLPHWDNGVTLNAFISVLSGFGRAALLVPTAEALGQLKWNWFSKKERNMMDFEILDSASRGPWGSFVLLARTKGLTLHSIGAAIILLTLPLDLFFQQIVAYPTVWVRSPQNGTIARLVNYDPVPRVVYLNGSRSLGNDIKTFGYSSAYFLENAIPYTIEPNCPTSNCTWEPFDTLGMCSKCADAGSLAEFGCHTTTGEWLPDVNLYNQPPNVTSCGWYLNQAGQTPLLLTGYSLNGNQPDTVMYTRTYNLQDIIFGQYLAPGGSFNFKDIHNPVVDFLVAASPNGFAGTLRNETPIVSECVISWCVKTIQNGYNSGTYTETVIKEQALNTNDWDVPWPDPNTYLPQFNLTLPDPNSSNGSSNYHMSNQTARIVQAGLQDYIPSNWYLPAQTPQSSDPYLSLPKVKFNQLEEVPWNGIGTTNPFNLNLQDLTKYVDSLATTLSNALRSAKDQNGQLNLVTGQAWESETHVDLRLGWIAVPVALLLFSLIFLITTVVASARADTTVGIWKTSALAVLFNGLSEDIMDTLGTKVKMGDTRRRAKSMNVHLAE